MFAFAEHELIQIEATKAVLQVDLYQYWNSPSNYDVFVSLNPNVNWYLGTDCKVQLVG